MKQIDFAHLHVHTVHSLLDGYTKMADLVDIVKSHGQKSVAVTDHGTMSGMPSLWREAKRANIKPIAGIEAYFCEDASIKNKENGRAPYHHLTLLAQNREGYSNLCRLVSESYSKGFYYKPRVDPDSLARNGRGIICLAGCVGGWPQQEYLTRGEDAACAAIHFLASLFEHSFFLEMQFTGEPDQVKVNKFFHEVHRRDGFPLVATGDSHYARSSDSDAHDTLLCMGIKKTKDDERRMRFNPGQYHIRSSEEMLRIGFSKDAYSNSVLIAEKCERYDLPKAGGIPMHPDAAGLLEQMAMEGMNLKLPEAGEEYYGRLAHELEIIHGLGFDDYFLVVRDVVSYAKLIRAYPGWGRGSSAGSLVAHVLGITDIDPIKYGLYFERFLNSSRGEPPDIDLDFVDSKRDAIIAHIEEKYGKDHVAQIGTFSSLGPKQAILDACRVFGKPPDVVAPILKILPYDASLKCEDILEMPLIAAKIEKTLGKEVVKCMRDFGGIPRNASIHAAGVVIDRDSIDGKLPLMCKPNVGKMASQYIYDDLHALGYTKFDILGVRTLRVLQEMIEKLKIDLHAIPLDDQNTFDMLCRGRGIGVFQLESWGCRQFLMEFKPRCFEDLIMIVALYRPGPLQNGSGIDRIIGRRNGRLNIEYAHPVLEEALGSTYGIMVFQEQVMKVVQLLAGWSLAEADILRHAIGKKKKEKIEELKVKFIEGCQKKGHSAEFAMQMFHEIEFFGRYGFNRAHAAVYAMVAYATAYLKTNYGAAYMAEVFNAELSATDKYDSIHEIARECTAMGIKVAHPDINQSEIGYRQDLSGGKSCILAGLAAVRHITEATAADIITERQVRDYFQSIEDFRERFPKRTVNSLAFAELRKARAFERLSETTARTDVPF